jgi:two-component system phosphate regulon response regulator PhoB
LVEDDPDLRSLFRTVLRAAGYAVIAVDDGMDALRYVEQTIPAAVVLDFGLPRVAGRDVHRELAAHDHTRHIPVIVVTGESNDIDEREFACVLRKPIRPEDLVDAVERCLRRHT